MQVTLVKILNNSYIFYTLNFITQGQAQNMKVEICIFMDILTCLIFLCLQYVALIICKSFYN